MHYTSKLVYEFISKQTNDPIVERKTCKVSGTEFPIYKSDTEFYDKVSPVFNWMKYQIPTPSLCPEERQRRRLMFRNERKLYKRKCDATNKNIISIYSPDKPYKVYDQKFWRSDWRDPMDYGKVFDFDRNFGEQFGELNSDIPKITIMNDDWLWTSENCWYCQDFAFGKNCYMVTSSWYVNNCFYCDCVLDSQDLLDCTMLNNKCNNVYYWINCDNIQSCIYIQDSISCHNCMFCYWLNNCSNCFGSIGLWNKSYCIFNKQYTKEEYMIKIEELNKLWYEYCLKHFLEHKESFISASTTLRMSKNCFGNNVINSKDIVLWFDIFDTENSKYVTRVNTHAKDCYDTYQSGSPVLSYENVTSDKSYHCAFVTRCWEWCNYIYYSDNCHSCSHLFWCIWLRNKLYCIFNKQYTKEEYNQLVPKIIEHMQKTGERWEFFDPSLSPFWYNETVAQEYFPLTRQEALDRWYKRQDNNYDPVIPEWANVVKSDQIESLKSDDEILKSIFICEVSGRPFRIIKQELEFYRKHNLPLPTKHPDIRHEERIKLRPKRELHLRNCDNCEIEIVSVYPKDFEGKVYCEACYNREIYG